MSPRAYIRVLLPLRLEWEPCYCIPGEQKLRIGQRIEVSFSGRNYIGVVTAVELTPGLDASKVRPAGRLDTALPDITPGELRLWYWIASYYACTPGEVYKAAYPQGKLLGEEVSARTDARKRAVLEKEMALYRARISRLESRILAKRESLSRLKNPDTKVYQATSESLCKLEAELSGLKDRLGQIIQPELAASAATSGVKPALEAPEPATESIPEGTAARRKPLLLIGPERTGHYLSAISRQLSAGRSTLILVPEIKRAESLRKSLEGNFRGNLLLYHSALSVASRRVVAESLRAASPCVVLGTRSALFLPFVNLGLVIVDDEQDPSYKQSEPSPRYNARDCSVALAAIHGSDVILGSPWPSLESRLNSLSGKYDSESLPGEQDSQSPWMEVIDVVAERKKRGLSGMLSFKLLEALSQTAAKGLRSLVLAPSWVMEDIRQTLREKAADVFDSVIVANIFTSKWENPQRLGLVAVVQSDSMLSRSDFRADERAIQILEVYRSKITRGRFIVQTSRASHPVYAFSQSLSGEGGGLRDGQAEALLRERREFGYPPYTRIVDLVCCDSNSKRMPLMLHLLSDKLRGLKGLTIMTLEDRVRVIFPKDKLLQARKQSLAQALKEFESERSYHGHFHIDVDPV